MLAGQQHWPTVHAADLADLFRRVLEDDSARGYYVVGDGRNPTVAELTEAAAVAVGVQGLSPARMRRLGPAWVTISPRCCCSIRARQRPGPDPNSVGSHPVPGWWTSTAKAVTGTDH